MIFEVHFLMKGYWHGTAVLTQRIAARIIRTVADEYESPETRGLARTRNSSSRSPYWAAAKELNLSYHNMVEKMVSALW